MRPQLGGHDYGMNRPWGLVARQLRSKPGSWARIVNGESQDPISYRIEAGYGDFAPAGQFETDVHRIDGLVFVWARMRSDEELLMWRARKALERPGSGSTHGGN